MTTTTTKNEEKGCWVGEQLKLCLCSDLVPVNPPTLHDEHYLHTVFIEPLWCVSLCVSRCVCMNVTGFFCCCFFPVCGCDCDFCSCKRESTSYGGRRSDKAGWPQTGGDRLLIAACNKLNLIFLQLCSPSLETYDSDSLRSTVAVNLFQQQL